MVTRFDSIRLGGEMQLTFRVSAWVHPEQGGDDDLVDFYFAAAPTDEQIRALLREAGSAVLDDYWVVPL